MPRTIWSSAISFGLVTVPINVLSATEDHSIHFHRYHLADHGRIRYRKVCEPASLAKTARSFGSLLGSCLSKTFFPAGVSPCP